ncbi:hypothetical protein [Flavobacterium sp.]|uniref:hypothetical protein n=1 Tax=Flavobacterium sp. TaxID=239 RepID=UPI002ED7CB8B
MLPALAGGMQIGIEWALAKWISLAKALMLDLQNLQLKLEAIKNQTHNQKILDLMTLPVETAVFS